MGYNGKEIEIINKSIDMEGIEMRGWI